MPLRSFFCSHLVHRLIWVMGFVMAGLNLCAQTESTSQVISLNSGWNLISIQIGKPLTPEQFKSAMLNPERLQQVWGYVESGNPSVPGHWNAYSNNAGRPKTASGVVSAERNTVTLYADITDLQHGIKTDQITGYIGNLAETITVQLDGVHRVLCRLRAIPECAGSLNPIAECHSQFS